jgi:hypothetical protein
VARAAQITLLTPSLVQLGAEVTAPASFVQPAQVEPSNLFTSSVLAKLRAEQTTIPPGIAAHDGSEFTAVLPSEVKGPQAASTGCVDRQTRKSAQQRVRANLMFISPSESRQRA